MAVTVRSAEIGDIEDIRAVASRAWRSAHSPIIGAEKVEAFLDEYYDAGSLSLPNRYYR
jgi:hypothetical protein